MKTILVLMALTISNFALAESQILLTCDHTMHNVSLKIKASGSVLIDDGTGEPVQSYMIQGRGLRDVTAGTSATVTAQKKGASVRAGTWDNAILLRIFDGQKEARLARDGSVFLLNCQK